MLNVTFILPNEENITVVANEGDSLMQTAVDNGIEQISADCGGCCSCATCHCYVDEAWLEKLTPADATEEGLLTSVIEDYQANSRLSCQIFLTEEHDGLIVTVPESDW